MSDKYVKTSAEELTAMADELRAIGPFEEGQQFVFPSSEYDENPVYVFKIVESGAWSEITRAEADELIGQGYDVQEVDEFPAIDKAVVNTVYFTVQRQLGFAEAYEEAIQCFYEKVQHGTLTQNDIDGLVLDYNNKYLFMYPSLGGDFGSFPNITDIYVTARWCRENGRPNRLGNLTTVHIIDPENVDIISQGKFYINWPIGPLQTIKCQPLELQSMAFAYCNNLTVGENGLDLSRCIKYYSSCFVGCNIQSLEIAEGCQLIGGTAFKDNSQLEEIYLPLIPPQLDNTDAFSGTSNSLAFYVDQSVISYHIYNGNWVTKTKTEAYDLINNSNYSIEYLTDINDRPSEGVPNTVYIISKYATATNWQDLISKFEVIV